MIAMSTELWALFGTFAVALVSILAQGMYLDLRSGIPYVLSSRDTTAPNHGPLGGRLDRNVGNQVEGMILFLPLVAVSELAGISNVWTVNAALVYLAARVLYLPAYAFGLVPFRTMIWSAGLFALFAYGWGILSATAFA